MAIISSDDLRRWVTGIEEAQSLIDMKAPDQAQRALEEILSDMKLHA